MARIQLTTALLLVAGTMAVAGCESWKVTGDPDPRPRSTYGNITDYDEDAWRRPPAPAPKPVAAAPAPAPKPAPAPAPAPRMDGNCMFLPTGDKATSALSICCKMPGEVMANQNFSYEVDICNLTGQALNNVVVVYTLEGARIVSSEPPISGTGFAVGDLAPRQCRTVKVTAVATNTGTVKGCTSATWANALCCGTNVVSPALKITKAVTPNDITVCDMVTYTITVENTGTGNASNVKVTDNLPAGVTSSDGRNAMTWDAGTLGTGQTRTFSFQAKAGKPGSYVNNASAAADNNLSARSNDVSFSARQATLSITKQCPQKLRVGQPATFRITVANTSDSPATNVVVEDVIPSTFVFGSATDGGAVAGNAVRWNIGNLAARTSKELTVTFRSQGMGKVNNVARATATCADAVTANCDCEFIGTPDIGTLLTDNDGVVMVGDNHEYRVAVKNQGQIPLTGTKFTVTLPANVAFVSSAFKHTVSGNKVIFDCGTVNAGAEVNFTYLAKGTKAGEALSIGETTCNELQTPVRDDELTNFVDK